MTSHMDRVRAIQRRGQYTHLQRAFVHYRALPDKAPIEEAELAEVMRTMAELEAEMRAAGQEPLFVVGSGGPVQPARRQGTVAWPT